MIGPVLAFAGAMSALALLAAEAARAKAAQAAQSTQAAAARRAASAHAQAATTKQKAKEAVRAVVDTAADITPGYPVEVVTTPAAQPATPSPEPAAQRPREAAEELYRYVTEKVRAGQGAHLGTKASPNLNVKRWQTHMGRLTADGIYGPKTRARGKELLGREFPAREGPKVAPRKPAPLPAPRPMTAKPPAPPKPAPPAPPKPAPQVTFGPAQVITPPKAAAKPAAPVKRSPEDAARALYAYATEALASKQGHLLGTRARPSAEVKAAQQDMGGLVADGIYGPSTRTRGRALLGRVFPIRR